jgi:DNA (cytosine-5)-methyltransferase 1
MGRQDFETETMVVQSVALRGREGGATAELGGDLAGTLRVSMGGGDKPHVLAPITFSYKDNGRDACVDLSPTLRSGNHGTSHANGGQPPAIAFDSRQDPVSSDRVFGALGSSSPQAQAVCVTGDVTHTLKAEGFDASEDGTGRGQPIIPTLAFAQNTRDEVRLLGGDGEISGALAVQAGMKQTTYVAPGGMAVRRLTPRECERLQGFPDDYTLIPTARGSSIKPHELEEWIAYLRTEYPQITRMEAKLMAPDGPRYKALGNSMAVPCMHWIGCRINNALNFADEHEIARAA